MEIIALDAHKRYSQVCVQKQDGQFLCERRINHSKGAIKGFLSRWTAGSYVALETVGNYYWIVDEKIWNDRFWACIVYTDPQARRLEPSGRRGLLSRDGRAAHNLLRYQTPPSEFLFSSGG